jgi:predicted transcriptional regulator
MGDEMGGEGVLDVLGDAEARRLLASVATEPQSAKELGSEHDLSLPTVYRRLDRLQNHGLVSSQTAVTDDGTHYKVYQTAFERAVVGLGDDGTYHVSVDDERREDAASGEETE